MAIDRRLARAPLQGGPLTDDDLRRMSQNGNRPDGIEGVSLGLPAPSLTRTLTVECGSSWLSNHSGRS